MNSADVYAWVGAGLIGMGLHALIVQAHLLRKILALNITGSGVFLLLVVPSQPAPGLPPDPVSQALVITGIVVAVSATAFAIVLLRKLSALTQRADLTDRQNGP
jgi:multicomponent Na+:H+ antiporter subunit C